MKLAIFLMFSIFTISNGFAKTGTPDEWVTAFTSCFNDAINANRKQLDVGKTKDECIQKIRQRYSLSESDANFEARLKENTKSLLNLNVASQGKNYPRILLYGGNCLNYEDPLPQLEETPDQIIRKMLADPGIQSDRLMCNDGINGLRFGFSQVKGSCVRVCGQGETLWGQLGKDLAYIFSCQPCSVVMAEIQENEGIKDKNFQFNYSYTVPEQNECVDFKGCSRIEESVNGKCMKKCEPHFIRNLKTLVCERGPKACEEGIRKKLAEADEYVAAASNSIRQGQGLGFCSPQQLQQYLQEIRNSYQLRIHTEVSSCQASPKEERYFYIDYLEHSGEQLNGAFGIRINEKCGDDVASEIQGYYYSVPSPR